MQISRAIAIPVMIIACGLLSACTTEKNPPAESFFPADESRTRQVLEAQVNKGARADATLHAAHFDGDRLNALGREKLRRMAIGAAGAMRVYLDVPPDMAQAREASVRGHVESAGLDEVSIHVGPNPATLRFVETMLPRPAAGEPQPAAQAPVEFRLAP